MTDVQRELGRVGERRAETDDAQLGREQPSLDRARSNRSACEKRTNAWNGAGRVRAGRSEGGNGTIGRQQGGGHRSWTRGWPPGGWGKLREHRRELDLHQVPT